jgi:hypothetical protein
MAGLWGLRKWLTLAEAAAFLTTRGPEHVREKDVYRLVLDRVLPVAVFLPVPVQATLIPSGLTEAVDGLWDVNLDGQAVTVYQGEKVCVLPPSYGPGGGLDLPRDASFVVRVPELLALAERLWPATTETPVAPQIPAGPVAVTPTVIARRKLAVQTYRSREGLTAGAMARKLGMNETTLRGIVREDSTRFGAANQAKLLAVLGLTRDDWYRA